ncbi:MAG: DUF4395 domain-containing protein [Nitrosomonadales bacterium]|nr:DUF4395 domain-containing protein [Nitrosomonadales bacterium]
MSLPIFQFGQQIPGYNVPVLNERAVRASAGILFFFAIVAFMNAWLLGDFQLTRVFVVAFLIDFTLRIFINPAYAPSLILGQWIVRKQQPEYVGAPQKRFAWAIGFALALTMLYLVVLNNVIGPVNLIVCSLCLLLLFFESAFGICLGCMVYRLFNDKAELCPGGVCESKPESGAGGNLSQGLIVLAFMLVLGFIANRLADRKPPVAAHADETVQTSPVDPAEAERCKVPEFAKAMGHEEKWKLHNNCK